MDEAKSQATKALEAEAQDKTRNTLLEASQEISFKVRSTEKKASWFEANVIEALHITEAQ